MRGIDCSLNLVLGNPGPTGIAKNSLERFLAPW